MRAYELMVILNPEVEDKAVEPTLTKFLEVVTKDNGTVDNMDIWGRRKLAYEIQKKSEGIYAVVNFTSTPETAAELDRGLNLNESVMRTKIIRPEDQQSKCLRRALFTKMSDPRAKLQILTLITTGGITWLAIPSLPSSVT